MSYNASTLLWYHFCNVIVGPRRYSIPGVTIAEYACLVLPSKVTMVQRLVAREIASRESVNIMQVTRSTAGCDDMCALMNS